MKMIDKQRRLERDGNVDSRERETVFAWERYIRVSLPIFQYYFFSHRPTYTFIKVAI